MKQKHYNILVFVVLAYCLMHIGHHYNTEKEYKKRFDALDKNLNEIHQTIQ